MKKLLVIFFMGGFLFLLGWNFPEEKTRGLDHTVSYFKREAKSFSRSSATLRQAIAAIDAADKKSIPHAKNALALCRQDYKKIEFFLEYFFSSTSQVYNAPPEFEVEEPSLEFQEPMGLQQIEALLFQADPVAHKKELLLQAEAVCSSAQDLSSLLYNFKATDAQILEALRLELIRVISLSLTGFDAPQLKTGIKEAYFAISSIREITQLYRKEELPEHEQLNRQLVATLKYLQQNPDFDSFNRMLFLTRYVLPLQKQLGRLITDLGLELNTGKLLNYRAENIFSKDAFYPGAFIGNDSISPELIQLGEKLFFEKALSGNNTRGCASCHIPENYFTDKLPKSMALDGHSFVKRNAPSLLYSGLQHAQFWDGRASSLTDQIVMVIQDAQEMNGNEAAIRQYIVKNKNYQAAFKAAFPAIEIQNVNTKQVAEAIAAYISSLNPINSAFDKYVQGNSQALNQNQINGFNLFTGKARCATCHFMPLFNSLLPPDYSITEYEVIGTTLSDDLKHPLKDEDLGRYAHYPVKFYRGAFKTPTVRNAAETAPYMHNGGFKDLKSVLDFYNKGGGHGLGLPNELQTLSAEPLNLTAQESEDIIQFIHSLTDKLPTSKNSFSP